MHQIKYINIPTAPTIGPCETAAGNPRTRDMGNMCICHGNHVHVTCNPCGTGSCTCYMEALFIHHGGIVYMLWNSCTCDMEWHTCDMESCTCDMNTMYIWHGNHVHVTWESCTCYMETMYIWHETMYMWHGIHVRVTWRPHQPKAGGDHCGSEAKILGNPIYSGIYEYRLGNIDSGMPDSGTGSRI